MTKGYLKLLKQQAQQVGFRNLAKKTVSRQSLHNLFSEKDVRLSTLASVAKHLGYDVDVKLSPLRNPNTRALRSSLKKFGAPLYDNDPVNLNLETTVLQALNSALKDKAVADVLPYVVARNANAVDWYQVVQGLQSEENRQLLGYFSELASRLNPHPKLQALLDLLQKLDFAPVDLTGNQSHGKYGTLLMESVDNPAAKKWNVKTYSRETDLLERYRKWQRLNSET